jgi:tetratricopeptide (TPR) repeat protein
MLLPPFLLFAAFAQGPAEWHAKGMDYLAAGELAEARRCFSKAIELDPISPALRINLGNVLVKLGRTDEAIKQFKTALSYDPRQVSALYNLGVLYLETADPRRASHFLQQAHRLSPQDDEIYKKHILALARAGPQADVKAALDALGPAKCRLSIGIGGELAVRQFYALAVDQYRREKECDPGNFSAVIGEAAALLAAGDPHKAIDAFEPYLEEARGNKHARSILGSANERLGRHTEAFEHFAAVVDLDPKDARAWMALGLLGLKARTPQLSAKVFEDAATRFPELPEFKLGQALVMQAAGNPHEAEQQCQALLAANPDYVPAKLFLVALHLDAARFGPALEILSSIQSSGSTLLAGYLRAAILFARADETPAPDLRSAMQALEASLGSDGRFADGHVLLARYYRTTDTSAAEKHLRLALQAEPNSWQAQAILAQLHRKQGNAELAQAEAKQAERLRQDVKHGQSLLWQMFYGGSTQP